MWAMNETQRENDCGRMSSRLGRRGFGGVVISAFFFFVLALGTAEDRDNAVVHGLLELTHDPACPACSLHHNLLNYFNISNTLPIWPAVLFIHTADPVLLIRI
jgi:hypothetical protein